MEEPRHPSSAEAAAATQSSAEWNVRSRLEALQDAAKHSDDCVLLSIATAAEQVYAQLSASSEDLERCRRDLLAQLATHQMLDERLREVLELAQRLDRPTPVRVRPGSASEPSAPRRSWWRRHRGPRQAVPPHTPFSPAPHPTPRDVDEPAGATPDTTSTSPITPAETMVTPRRRRTDLAPRDRHPSATAAPPAGALDDRVDPGRDEAALAAHMLGPFALLQNGTRILQTYGQKTQILLKYLLAHRDRAVPRDVLVELLWPDLDPEAGRRNLHQTVYALRRSLRAADPATQHVCFKNDGYALCDDLTVWCDVWEFEAAADRGRKLAEAGDDDGAIACFGSAAALYRGEYLADSPYDEWTVVDRERLRMRHHEVMEALGTLLSAHGRWDEAIATGQRLLRHDPLAEDAHRLIMAAYHARGQRSLAIQQYRICAHALQRELGVSPSADTEELYRELLA